MPKEENKINELAWKFSYIFPTEFLIFYWNISLIILSSHKFITSCEQSEAQSDKIDTAILMLVVLTLR